jgi:hypothetical protein
METEHHQHETHDDLQAMDIAQDSWLIVEQPQDLIIGESHRYNSGNSSSAPAQHSAFWRSASARIWIAFAVTVGIDIREPYLLPFGAARLTLAGTRATIRFPAGMNRSGSLMTSDHAARHCVR